MINLEKLDKEIDELLNQETAESLEHFFEHQIQKIKNVLSPIVQVGHYTLMCNPRKFKESIKNKKNVEVQILKRNTKEEKKISLEINPSLISVGETINEALSTIWLVNYIQTHEENTIYVKIFYDFVFQNKLANNQHHTKTLWLQSSINENIVLTEKDKNNVLLLENKKDIHWIFDNGFDFIVVNKDGEII